MSVAAIATTLLDRPSENWVVQDVNRAKRRYWFECRTIGMRYGSFGS
jgi:hypothetical protein